jgi:hypothetical protein
MIVRDEADNLPHLFASAKGLVDSWLLVDTGSTDATVEVARSLGATVIEDAWDDDFARSRNVGLDAVSELLGPDAWVVILDGDDRVENAGAIRQALEDASESVYALKVFSQTEGDGVESIYQTRAWKLSTGVRYRNPVHAAPKLDFLKDDMGNIVLNYLEGGCIRHLGYMTPEGRIRNAERTLRICREKMDPNDPQRLACECRALVLLNQWEEATTVALKLVMLFRKQGSISTTIPYLCASRGLLLAGEVEQSFLILAECVQMGGGSQSDVWMNLIQTAAFGLMAATVMQARGSGEMSSSGHKTFGVLTALTGVGLLEQGLPTQTMDELRAYAEEVTGSIVYSRGASVEGWDTARPTPEYRGNFPGPEGSKRILVVGDREIAAQVSTLSQAINDHTPHASVSCIFVSDYLDFQRSVHSVVLDKDGEAGFEKLKALAEEADLVHFVRFPTDASDICWGDFLGPTNTLIQYMGSQLRENADTFREWHEATGVLGIVAWDYTLLEKGWMPYHVPLAYSGASPPRPWRWSNWVGGPLRVCHAPTRREVKQTDLFLKVCQELVDEGHEIEPVLIEGVSNEECLTIKASCHVTYDQLSIGVHGMSAVESMALNHVVIAGISNWALSVHPRVPILRATESTLKDILGSLCTRDVYENELKRLQPVAWAKQMHDPSVVIQRLSYLYDLVWNGHRLLP